MAYGDNLIMAYKNYCCQNLLPALAISIGIVSLLKLPHGNNSGLLPGSTASKRSVAKLSMLTLPFYSLSPQLASRLSLCPFPSQLQGKESEETLQHGLPVRVCIPLVTLYPVDPEDSGCHG